MTETEVESPVPDHRSDGASVVDPLIGQVIDGRYRVVSKMATGGMATVYVARDQRLDRLVALKIMHPHLAQSGEFTERFRREARSAARIAHPGIVPIFDQGAYQGQGYLIMELVAGPDLRSYVRGSGPVSLGVALTFVEQILAALASAHRSGVIHRDLKPENVLVAHGQSLRLVDFGLARAVSDATLSSTGSILGTVAYLAPEVALKGTLDARTDIYSVGIMLYELLTGTVPGDQSNPLMVAMSRVNEDIPPPSGTADWLPSEVDNLVAALTARDPSERPANAAEASALVQQTRGSLTEEMLSRPLPQPQATQGRRLGEGTNATDLLASPSGTTVLPIEQRIVTTSGSLVSPEQKQFPKSSKRAVIITSVAMLLAILGLGVWWWWAQYGPGAYTEVPDVSNLSAEQAQAELEELGLGSFTTFEFSDTVPADLIITTDPRAGQKAHRSTEVNLVISKGIEMILIPDVQGLGVEEGGRSIEEAGLEVGTVDEVWSETVLEGVIIETTPAIGESIPHYDKVNLTVSKGRQPLTVPALVGMPADTAEATIVEMGLEASRSEAYSDDVEEGLVISQEPASGDVLYRGDTVSFVSSLGPEYLTVPDVYGMGVDSAIATLEQAGFQVEVKRVASFFNSVGAQSPQGGQSAVRGTVVVITVV